jgi:alpha-1,6-mannosyltransferase
MKHPKSLFLLLILLSLAAYLLLIYFTPRTHFAQLIGLYTVLFAAYAFFISKYGAEAYLRPLLAAALLFRLSLLFAWPNLSDDYFRFAWDGRLLANGFNPYLELPSQFIRTPGAETVGLNQDLYNQLNSPNYYTIYPPLNQALFALAAWLFPDKLLGSVVVWRLCILLAEVGTLFLLLRLCRRLHLPQSNVLLYALNPLVIVELTGNLHFEAVMIFFSLLALYWLSKEYSPSPLRQALSALSLALSVATKLMPLMLLPLLWKRLGFRRGLLYCTVVGLVLLLTFAPFLSADLVRHFTSSVNLYFRKFEFNASLYYLVRALGFVLKGYNVIGTAGPTLSLLALGAILYLAFQPAKLKVLIRSAPTEAHPFIFALFTFTVYYACATTVHPWYITTLVAFSVLTPYRFPLVWSALLPLTYFTYRTAAYEESLWLVALEYGFVFGWLIYEIGNKDLRQQPVTL